GITGSLPQGAGFDSVDTKRFSWIPTFDDSGSYTVVFNLSDGQGGSTSDSVSIRVINVNRAPVFDALADTMFVNEGDSLGFFVSAVDSDSDAVSYNVANLPSGATFDNVTGQFFWIPNFSQEGSYLIVFNALDGRGGTVFVSTTIIVNQPPVWAPVSGQFTQEGVQLLFKIFASDADGDSLSYSITNLPSGAVVTFPADSVQFSWTPQANQEGMYAVTFVVNDDKGGSDKVIVPIQVTSSTGQLPPTIIQTPDKTVNENANVIFQVVATDDGPQDSLTFGTVGGLPAGSAFDSTETHILQWTPTFSQSGVYTLIFKVTDKFTNTTLDTVIITVNNVNRAPVTVLPTDTTFSEGILITLPLNITDPDGDNVSIVYFEIPVGGIIDSSGVHTLLWTPTFLQEGSFNLRFQAKDDFKDVLNHTLNINISNNNRAPDSFSIVFPSQGEEVKTSGYLIWEQASDPDIDDSLSYSLDIDDDEAFGSINIHVDTVNNFVISQPSVTANILKEYQILLSKGSTTGEAFIMLVEDIPDINTLTDDAVYYWRVRAFDNHGGQSAFSSGTNSFHLNLMNDPPLAPVSGFSPSSEKSTTVPQPVFKWDPAEDPDYSDDPSKLSYAFELSNDNFAAGFQYRVVTNPGVDSVLSPVVFGDNETWYYRVKTFDDDGDSSAYSSVNQFFSNTIPEPPTAFGLLSPNDNFGYVARPDSIFFDWEDSSDPDPGTIITYRLELSVSPDFSTENVILYIDGIPESQSYITISTNVLEKDTYYWRVLAVDDNNLVTPSNEVRLFGLITSVDHDLNNTGIPRDFTVNQNYPNPFNNQTVIRYSLPYISGVTFKIYSITGQIVYSENQPAMNPGFYMFRWNGVSQSGAPVSSGTYFLVILTDRDVKSQKILLIK
ncbi:T9SS type A sorting domain-containing protein, partial [candidate division KSB1 bacterium]|nr:T9SS type A sorting domain-containing protein [candidate division KSB1 bacterium]